VPLGFYFGGFPGAIHGQLASDVVEYIVTQIGVAPRGLSSVRRASVATVLVALVSLIGLYVGETVQARTGSRWANLLSAGAVVCAIWAGPTLLYWRNERAKRRG
jgi:uncharacterized membrane protein